jgi:hypothetical protein
LPQTDPSDRGFHFDDVNAGTLNANFVFAACRS